MNIIVLSEFNLIKSTLKHAFRKFDCIDTILTVNPMNVLSIMQEKTYSSLGVGKPDIIVIDIDTSKLNSNYFELANELIMRDISFGDINPLVAIVSSRSQFDFFLSNYLLHVNGQDDIKCEWEYIQKPYTLSELNEFIKHILAARRFY